VRFHSAPAHIRGAIMREAARWETTEGVPLVDILDADAKRCHCDAIATVYAMDTIPGGWGDYYCDGHTPEGWITETLGKD